VSRACCSRMNCMVRSGSIDFFLSADCIGYFHSEPKLLSDFGGLREPALTPARSHCFLSTELNSILIYFCRGFLLDPFVGATFFGLPTPRFTKPSRADSGISQKGTPARGVSRRAPLKRPSAAQILMLDSPAPRRLATSFTVNMTPSRLPAIPRKPSTVAEFTSSAPSTRDTLIQAGSLIRKNSAISLYF
jgi:hypothetical protein